MTADGYIIQPGATIPTDALSVTINASGIVSARIAGSTTEQQVGQIELAIFPNEAGLEALGDNLFLETAASGAATIGTPGATGFGTIKQGALETSNVNVVNEITNLIAAQRAYEMNSKVIQASDEMMSSVSQLR